MAFAATNIQTPAARSIDPKSSHIAAAEMNRCGKRQTHIRQLAEVVVNNPGRTSAELAFIIADVHPHLNRHECARRLPDGEGGMFVKGVTRMCTITNRNCITWLPTEAAKNQYDLNVGVNEQ